MKAKVYDLVKDILLRYPETRNSDQKLIYMVWIKQGLTSPYQVENPFHEGLYFKDIKQFMESAHPKSIIENRRKLQREQEEKIMNGDYINEWDLLIANREVLQLREKRNQERGTHVLRDQVNLF